MELRTRRVYEEAVDLAALRIVGSLNLANKFSAVIIPFPVGRTRAGKVSTDGSSLAIDDGFTAVDTTAPVGLDEDTSAPSGPVLVKQDAVAAVMILEDATATVDAVQASSSEEGSITPDTEVALLKDEGAGATLRNSKVYSLGTTISNDVQPVLEALRSERGHKDWTRSQRRYFSAFASLGQSATAIARKMERSYDMSVSVKAVRLALAERDKKLSMVKPGKKASKG